MSLANLGSCGFADSCIPLKGKSEWGMDTLTRKVVGARSLADAYIATLAQGQTYPSGSSHPYYLQTWDPDDNPSVATITLNYKGLLTGGTPLPDKQNAIVTATGNTSSDFSDEGDPPGLGRLYRIDLIAGTGETPPGPGQYGTSIQYFRQRYAVTALMEFIYRTAETTYRYINVGEPNGPLYTEIDIDADTFMERVRITLSDGTILGRNSMAQFGLTPVAVDRIVSHQSKNVIGSPYWECQDVVRRTLEDG